jgi:hypothetical protein
MPDFERLTDSLRIFAAPDAVTREWAKGYAAGKKHARIQCAFTVAVAVVTFVALQVLTRA